ncbi:uncharacterized protein V2V93DRAFT_322264 [Kockiozyma suomiensis]|uniref:uncharacterized protein n=1 Tax=Kockiozyma suomiensis TaxID=1337062 RepID=UPI003343C572
MIASQTVLLFIIAVSETSAEVLSGVWSGFAEYSTPHYFPTTRYRVTPQYTDFTVSSVTYWGKVNDFHAQSSDNSSWVNSRRAPLTFCAIGDNSFWFTGLQQSDDLTVPTSMAISQSSTHPSYVSDYSAFDPSSLIYFIPQSPEEAAIEANTAKLSMPRTNCAMISATRAVQFWDSWVDFASRGSFLVQYDLKVSNNSLTVTRFKDLYGSVAENQYSYGLFASMKVNSVVYMYALDTSEYGNSQDIFVASAPAEKVVVKSTWRYWHNSTQSWSTEEPLAVKSHKLDAIYSLSGSDTFAMGESLFSAGGSIFYSEYHSAYIMVYVSTDKTKYIIEYAPTPVGPWSTLKKVLYTDSKNSLAAALVTPAMFSTPAAAGKSGKSLLMTPASSNSEYDGLTYKLNFA